MNPTIEPWVIGLTVFGLLVFMGILVAFSLTLILRSRTELEEIKSRSVAITWTARNVKRDDEQKAPKTLGAFWRSYVTPKGLRTIAARSS